MSIQSPGPDRAAAASAVKGPAIFLIVVACLGVLAAIASLGFSSVVREAIAQDPNIPEQQRKVAEVMYGTGAWIMYGWGLLAALVALFGGVSMLRMRSWGFALAGCIFAALNPSCFCCVLGLGPAIWGMVVLLRPEVKAAFGQPVS